MYVIMCTRSETASCPQHTPGMYTSIASVSRHMQGEGLRFLKVTWSLLKLDMSVEIYDSLWDLVLGSKHVLAPNNLVDFHHAPILEHLQLSLQQETVKQSEASILVLRSLFVIPYETQETERGCPETRGQAPEEGLHPEPNRMAAHSSCHSDWRITSVYFNFLSKYDQTKRITQLLKG